VKRLPAQLLGALALTAIAGCGVPTQSSPQLLHDNNVHVVGRVPSTTRSPDAWTDRAELCFIADDRLVTIVRELPAPLSIQRTLEALSEFARTGLPVGIRSAISSTDIVAADNALAARGIARVDLKTEFAQNSPADKILAVAQIVCTLTDLPGVGQVRFTVDGQPADIPRADGSLTREPVSRFDYRALLPTS